MQKYAKLFKFQQTNNIKMPKSGHEKSDNSKNRL